MISHYRICKSTPFGDRWITKSANNELAARQIAMISWCNPKRGEYIKKVVESSFVVIPNKRVHGV